MIDLPLTVPLEGPIPEQRLEEAERALARAMEIAGEYPGSRPTRATSSLATSARRSSRSPQKRAVEAIIVGGEPPTRIRGGALLGGVGGSKPAEVGPITEYVLKHAVCRILLTAPARWVNNIGAHADPDRWMRARRLVRRPSDARRRARGLVPRRGSGLARAARARARDVVGGRRRSVHGRHRPRDRRADDGRDRAGGRLRRLDRTATTRTSSSPRSLSGDSRSRRSSPGSSIPTGPSGTRPRA